MKYETEIKKICGEDWKTVNNEERDGGHGVAIVKAYIHGTKPSLGELSRCLGVTADELSKPFSRLMKNKVIGRDAMWDVSNDAALLGRDEESEYYRMWSFVAAVAGGLIGNQN